jgi:hypothetical protein
MPVDYEHREQAALFDWIEMRAARYPELALAFAVPNGGKRGKAAAAKLKKEGLKSGVPDIVIPVPRYPHHGMFIELKAVYPNGRRGRPTPEQVGWIDTLRMRGYRVEVCWGWQEAAAAIEQYMNGGRW